MLPFKTGFYRLAYNILKFQFKNLSSKANRTNKDNRHILDFENPLQRNHSLKDLRE